MRFVAVDEYIVEPNQNMSQGQVNELLKQLRPMYNASIAIAARAGDEWAIQSYFEKEVRGDIEYWQSVHEINPLLSHRLMSSQLGSRWLTEEQQLLHARQAYELSKEVLPTLEKIPFERYAQRRNLAVRYNESHWKSVQRLVDEGFWQSEIEYPWNLVPIRHREIQRNLGAMNYKRSSNL